MDKNKLAVHHQELEHTYKCAAYKCKVASVAFEVAERAFIESLLEDLEGTGSVEYVYACWIFTATREYEFPGDIIQGNLIESLKVRRR